MSPLLLLVTFGLLFAVLVPGLGLHAEGSSRWIGFGQVRLQPSELMKLALTIFAADFIARRLDQGSPDRRIMGPLLLVTAAASALILAQPDMGTAMVVGCLALTMLFVSGVRIGPVMKLLAGGRRWPLVVAVASPYRRERLLSFLDPSAHSSGSGYQVVQSLIGLGSGHLIGIGAGRRPGRSGVSSPTPTPTSSSRSSARSWASWAPWPCSSSSAPSCGSGSVRPRGHRTASAACWPSALVAWVASETLINVGAVVGVLPVTGIPLPFISFGGSSLVITMAAAGILINIARHEPTRPRRHPPSRAAAARRAAGFAAVRGRGR